MAVCQQADPGFLDGSAKSRSFLEALSRSSIPVLLSWRSCSVGLGRGVFALAEPFKFLLVGFFPSRRPYLASIQNIFLNLRFNGVFSVTLLDQSHVLIKLENDIDYSRVFCHRSYLVSIVS
ncbi:hypothetical protein IEQ34_004904 [Dendrobium chrysotoxum]|uniref:Uncharacterized protein n=1 Tax=Dendrobium chrysotoxum TaxID=161865 RepID=A0AAV7H7D8_DENCH|nr:hypothetical protein IEQ34_004904 [Dendrobium chrysotoxum]